MIQRTLLSGKIHRATITGADLDYNGSITIDTDLLRAAGILPHERVLVANVTNGNRLETYALAGAAGSGICQINGAGAHQFQRGDLAIIMAFVQADADTPGLDRGAPRVVLVDAQNRVAKIV